VNNFFLNNPKVLLISKIFSTFAQILLILAKMKYIERNAYFKKVKPFIDKKLIKVITGQRRVGKSYFLFQIISEIKKKSKNANIIYINKESEEFFFIVNYEDLLKYVKKVTSTKHKNYLFIDEIQDISGFEKALRSLNLKDNFDIYCTGSNAGMLSGDIASYLTGRYIVIEIHSLSYPEFLIFHKLKKTNDSLHQYIKYGGLPYIIHLDMNDEIIYEYLKNVYNTIILKDVVKRYNLRSYYFLENLVHYIADNFGTITSAKNISDYLKSQKLKYNPRVILEYLKFLEFSFLINKVRRYDIQGKKFFEINNKYYFEDLGLRNSIIRFRERDYNKVMENLVYQHLIFCGYEVFIGKYGDYEIDFVAQKNNVNIYLQVSYRIINEETHNREFGNLLKIKDNLRKIVVSMDNIIGGDFKGIEYITLLDFLTKEL
jgi:uncharacterized protein